MDGVTPTTPFLEFRLWWRRASPGKQAAAVGAVATALALVVWIAVPLASGPSTNLGAGYGSGARGANATGESAGTAGTATTASGTASPAGPGSAGGTGATGRAAGGSGATAGGALPGTAGGSLAGCSGPAKTMNVGVVLLDAAGLDNVFGAPNPSQQRGMWNAMFDSINKSGGAACNKLVPDFQTDDEFNPSSAQNDCLTFVQHKVFAVMGGFLPQSPDTCLLQNHIPDLEELQLSAADVQRYYPYYFSGVGQIQVVYRNWANATRQFNMFDPAHGFKKIGIFYRDCQPEVNAAMLADLQAAGVPSSAIDRADLGCSSAFAPPSSIEQAVLKFKGDGVTTATIDNDLQDVQNITRTSQSQGFRPQWTIPDQGTVATTGNPSFSPDPNNFNNALAITPFQYGANNMPGFKESPTDLECDQIMTSHGQPAVMASGGVQFAGAVCDLMWMFVAAVDHAPSVAPDQLAAGLQRAGSVSFSFPYGPNNFSAPGTTWGGELWRPVTYHTSCGCWQLDNPNFQPSF